MKMTWADKNERRKHRKGEKGSLARRNYNDGRKNRHVLANAGAFGSLSGRSHNLCAMGTNSPRVDSDDE